MAVPFENETGNDPVAESQDDQPTIVEIEDGLLIVDGDLASKLHAAVENRWRRSWKPNILRSTQIVGGRREPLSICGTCPFLSFVSGGKGRLALRGYRLRKHRYSVSVAGGAVVVRGI